MALLSWAFDKKSNTDFVLLLILWAAVHAGLFYFFGVRDQFVDSQRYIGMANYFAVHGSLEFSYQIFYAVPICFLAFCQVVFVDSSVAYVIIQSVVSFFAAWFLYRAANRAFSDRLAGLCAAGIFLVWFDCIQWNTAVMTESLAATFICLVLYVLATFKERAKDILRLLALSVLCLLTRPTGAIIAVSIVIFMLTYFRTRLLARPGLNFFISVLIGLGFVFGAYAMLNEWDFTDQYVKGNIVTYMDVIEGKPYYYESLRLDTTGISLPDADRPAAQKVIFFAIQNPLHFLQAAILKVFYVITSYRPYFSTPHNVYTILWLTIIYVCAYVGFRRLDNKSLRNFCIGTILLNCVLVAVSAADWDNRFYMPMQPGIVLLAGGGLAYLVTWSYRNSPRFGKD